MCSLIVLRLIGPAAAARIIVLLGQFDCFPCVACFALVPMLGLFVFCVCSLFSELVVTLPLLLFPFVDDSVFVSVTFRFLYGTEMFVHWFVSQRLFFPCDY